MRLRTLPRTLFIAGALTLAFPVIAFAQDEGGGDDSALAQGEETLADLAAEQIENKCACPAEETEASVKKLEKCLKQQKKKAREKFAPTLKYLSLSGRLFKTALDANLADYPDSCFAPEDEEPGDDLPGDDQPGDQPPPGDGGGDEPPPA